MTSRWRGKRTRVLAKYKHLRNGRRVYLGVVPGELATHAVGGDAFARRMLASGAYARVHEQRPDGPHRLQRGSTLTQAPLVIPIELWTMIALVATGAVAGVLGALVGVGGGVLLVPALVLLFHIDPHIAVATSLIGVIATSTAAGSVYVGNGQTNMRLGMTLEVATTAGGLIGGVVAAYVSPDTLSGAFGFLMVVTAVLLVKKQDRQVAKKPHEETGRVAQPERKEGWEEPGRLAGGYYDEFQGETVHYRAERLGLGAAVSLLAGAVSGLLGVGGGFLKVPAMSLGMRVPIRVAAATSNFMIGVTAVTSLFVYFARGDVYPYLAAPIALGVVSGSLFGTTISGKIPSKGLRWIMAGVLAFVAVQMLLRAFGGRS